MKFILLLPLIVAISGCTIPGTGIIIPGFGETISLENDIIVITDLTAIPNTVTAPQTIKLIATVQNRGDTKFTSNEPVSVELFDYCVGLFDKVIIANPSDCPGQVNGLTCDISELLPQETQEVRWLLEPREDTKLITPCDLKISATYPYQTDGLTTIHFINSVEYNHQLQQGSFTPRTSTNSLGQGPVKAWFEVKDQQPIPAIPQGTGLATVPVNLVIQNQGLGFVKKHPSANNQEQIKVASTNIFSPPFSALSDTCADEVNQGLVKLIQNKRTLPCNIRQLYDCTGGASANCVAKETTYKLEVAIDYLYEFRKEVRVTVEPKALI